VEAAIPMGITTVRDAPRAAPAPAITLDTNDLLIAGRRRKYDNVGFVLAVNLEVVLVVILPNFARQESQ
jgi:hypothetical protein